METENTTTDAHYLLLEDNVRISVRLILAVILLEVMMFAHSAATGQGWAIWLMAIVAFGATNIVFVLVLVDDVRQLKQAKRQLS